MVLVMILLMTLLGLNPYVENSLVNTADCFVDYYQDIYKYKNIFNKDIMRYEVKTRCEDDISKNVSNNDELSKIDETGKQNNQSMGKCHLIVRPQDNGVCITREVPLAYEYPKVSRRDPGNVGDIQEVVFKTGMIHKIITKAVNPPVFEIPSFFSHKECEYIIAKAQENGMEASGLVGENINDQLESNKSLADIDRVSQTSWLWKKDIGNNVWLKLRKRVSKLTLLPLTAVKQSEAIQVVQYQPGGHYHVHIDSTDNNYTLPCCFQSDRCQSLIHTAQWKKCCRFCRFITVMVYLNDTEEGGQTAFPFADVDDATVKVFVKDI